MNSKDHLIPIVLLSLLLYSVLSLAATGRELRQASAGLESLGEEYERLQLETRQLQDKLQDELDNRQIAQLARQRLGLVLPGEKIFYFTLDREG